MTPYAENSGGPTISSQDSDSGELLVLAPAKVNLFLELMGKRPDGYHEISTVMQTIDLFDELKLRKAPSGITLRCLGHSVPEGSKNIVCRAARLLLDAYRPSAGVQIQLAKRIPPAAGLGGASSDAAATLIALNLLWNLGLSANQLMQLAAQLGSDVPFFISGGTGLCTGRGEVVSPIKSEVELQYVVVCPPVAVLTASVYARSKMGLTGSRRLANILIEALEEGSIVEIGNALFNRLESITLALYPSLLGLRQVMAAMPFAGISMSGSGSAFLGICASGREVTEAVQKLSEKGVGQVFSARSRV